MNALLPKGGIFFVLSWRRRSNFLSTFVNNPLNMLLLNSLAWHTEWPTISRWNIFIKLSRLCLIRIRTWKATMLCACVIVLKSWVVRAKCVRCRIHEVLSLVKITWFVECAWTSVFGSRFNRWESRILSKGICLFRRRIWQCRWCHLITVAERNKYLFIGFT